ncbi:hypothetical protein CYJ73_17335 [Gordonia terrae]|uniref:Terminase n=1 Tax=Gordonia terrae TaxID=2055 RepID=A0A2I1R5E3_9ACTN|nr:hypothetical protein [Gordonia terrae]PKZ64361.1 hypothetical protein CYJ73_17335 [Gordonia terrae]UPW07828.1 hypothetical protein M1C59_17395 [Gordonia terrae]
MTITKTEMRGWSKNARSWIESVLDVYELTASEKILAREVCRGIDRLDQIADALRGQSLTVENRFGETVTNPLVVEQRLLSQSVAKLSGSLRLPEIDAEDTAGKVSGRTGGKQPKRVQMRNMYGPSVGRDPVARKLGLA